MNVPNMLTILRIFLVPFFVFFLLLPGIPHSYLIAGVIFAVASLTDLLDGKIARRHNLITDFGKFADPLADKILILSAFVCFVEMGIIGAVPVIIILFREFTVTSIRLVAAGEGTVIAANIWGKVKTVSQIIAVVIVIISKYFLQLIGMGIVPLQSEFLQLEAIINILNAAVIWISVIFTLISGIFYLKDNWKFISNAR